MTMKTGPEITAQGHVLPEEQLARAQYYICYERHLYHLYCILRNSSMFSLFFMDRCYDWQFDDTGSEGIISRYNGFMEVICRESWVEKVITEGQLAGEIRRALRAGSHMAIPLFVVHVDGTTYPTEFLIEAIDDDDTVYYTKTNSTQNSFRMPMSFSDLADRIVFTDDGLVPVTEIRPSATIERILEAGSVEAFRAVFAEYGLRWYEGRLHRYVTPVVVEVDGIDRLIEAWGQRAEEIVAAGAVDKKDQFRLNKHLQNRFHPVQHFLQFLTEDDRIRAAMGESLVDRTRREWGSMDAALTGILKFGSLLVQRPATSSFDLYLKYLLRLRETVPEYQRTIIEIQRALTG